MIRRAFWLGGIGAVSTLSLYVLLRLGVPMPVVFAMRILVPAFLIWHVFRPYLINRPFIRLIDVLGSFVGALLFIVLILSQPFNVIVPANVRIAIALVESTALVLLAFWVPHALGTPSVVRSGLRIGIAEMAVIPLHFAFDALTDSVATAGVQSLYSFGILFGIPAIKWGVFFAALAPDHIAMERAARARKLPLSCEKCAYDLTGNVSGVCPECGTTISEAVRQRLIPRSENAWGAEQVPAMEMDKE